MPRSEITIDLGALRRNVERLREVAAPAEVWAVVKADAYGHGAVDAARAALAGGAAALCVATVAEGEELRAAFPDGRVLVMSPLDAGEEGRAREARLQVALSEPSVPEGLQVHFKVDTGMGRWGMSVADALTLPRERLVGLMGHLATADEEDESFARAQIARFQEVTRAFPGVPAHLANSAGTLRFADARLDAVRCGIAIYGLSPFGDDPASHGLEPVLSWRSHVALTRELAPGESTGYGRRFVADAPARIGHRPGRLRGRVPARAHRHGGPRRGGTAPGGRDDLDGLVRRRARGRTGGNARDADRRRCPRRGARARPRHDQLRDHVRDRA